MAASAQSIIPVSRPETASTMMLEELKSGCDRTSGRWENIDGMASRDFCMIGWNLDGRWLSKIRRALIYSWRISSMELGSTLWGDFHDTAKKLSQHCYHLAGYRMMRTFLPCKVNHETCSQDNILIGFLVVSIRKDELNIADTWNPV